MLKNGKGAYMNSHVWEVKCEEGGGIRSGVLKKKKKIERRVLFKQAEILWNKRNSVAKLPFWAMDFTFSTNDTKKWE